MSRINELRLIARVAQMYYGEGRRQAEIAEHLHMSQATVSRMLKRAEREDIVRTTVIPPAGTFADLEAVARQSRDAARRFRRAGVRAMRRRRFPRRGRGDPGRTISL